MTTQFYVDDITFESTKDELAQYFSLTIQEEFEISLLNELKSFLGFQVKQSKDGNFLFQSKYVKDMVKKFGLDKALTTHTLMSTSICLSQDPSRNDVKKTLIRV